MISQMPFCRELAQTHWTLKRLLLSVNLANVTTQILFVKEKFPAEGAFPPLLLMWSFVLSKSKATSIDVVTNITFNYFRFVMNTFLMVGKLRLRTESLLARIALVGLFSGMWIDVDIQFVLRRCRFVAQVAHVSTFSGMSNLMIG